MSLGPLAVVEAWLVVGNCGDGQRVEDLSAEDVEIVGPRASVRGRQVLSGWMTRAGFSAEALRWFCGANGLVVVEQDARWVDQVTGAEQGRAVVASQFLIEGTRVVRYARHDNVHVALKAAGLGLGDEVTARKGG